MQEAIPSTPAAIDAAVLRGIRKERPLCRFLLALSRSVGAQGGSLCLAGGTVRDLLAGRPGNDVDLLVAGVDAAGLGKVLGSLPARELGIRGVLRVGKRFPVYKVKTAWGPVPVDVATARGDSPPYPAPVPSAGIRSSLALPEASAAALASDASRRDFTMNSLLFLLRPRGNALQGTLLDFFGGLKDLRARRIRAVRDPEARFREDPVRMLRAVRLRRERPGFRIERDTRAAIRRLAPVLLPSVPGECSIGELHRALSASPEGAPEDLHRLGLLPLLLPGAAGGRCGASRLKARMRHLARSLGTPVPVAPLFAAFLADVPREEQEPVSRALHVPSVRRVLRLLEDAARLERAPGRPNPHAAVEAILARWRDPSHLLAFHGSLRKSARRRVADYRPLLRMASKTPPVVTGDDLLRLGVPAGPGMPALLERLREATLTGEIRGREEALRLAASLAARK